ncbi:MAG: multidrug effflux MFS transporter [Alphaproteobacteria bacterium]|nr:multidrug effflux MFS transporter [Alphaproteobacteria bacterium]
MHSLPLLILLAGCSGLGLLASAIYVPSMPDMARIFGTGIGEVQLTLSVFLASFAVATLVHGPLSDRFGRRRVLIAGLVLCAVSSFACSFAPNIETLIALRAFQAFGSCAGMVVVRAVIRDLYGPEHMPRAMAFVALGVTLSPALAPILGGQLHVRFGWWASFDFVAAFTALLTLLIFLRLPETNRHPPPPGSLLAGMAGSFASLLGARQFMVYALVIAFAASGFYGFAAGAPVVLIDAYGVAPDFYGLFAAFPPAGFICGTLLTSRVLRRAGSPDRLISIGTLVISVAGGAMALLSWSGIQSPLAVAGPMLLYGFGNGLIMPNAFAGSMRYYPRIAGAASALAGFLQQAAGAVATTALTLLPQTSSKPLTFQVALSAIGAALVWRLLRGGRLPPPRPVA